MQIEAAQKFIDTLWHDEIVGQLTEYIRIPNKSPHFDPDWAEHGFMEEAVRLIESWCRRQPIDGMSVEVCRLEGRTPLIFIEIPGDSDDTVLLYGHLDKQPEMEGWSEGLGPWQPVYRDGRLYGRGGADDGYAAYSALAAVMALCEQGLPHARCVVIIEGCEESGSYDLPYYIEHLGERIGTPSLVVCLDSGAGNYDQLWVTTSLRGMAAGTLNVEVLTEGVHSGAAGGIVPSSFRIARHLLSRLEDEDSGKITPQAFQAEIPAQRREQLQAVAEALGDEVHTAFQFIGDTEPMATTPLDRLLNRNWRASLSVTGAGGLPRINDAGNVLRPGTALKLSLRLPPTLDSQAAGMALKELLEMNPPYNARVTFETGSVASGWNAPAEAPWLRRSLQKASLETFGRDCMYMGEGGTIPFMGMLGQRFPDAQFMIVGVLGPGSNAHGPNEFLHVPYARRLTTCVAHVIADHYRRS